MINRLRRGVRQGAAVGAQLARLMAEAFDQEDVLLLIGLALLAGGLWLVSHALAFIVPGVVLVWIFLPPRPPLIEAPTRTRRSAS